jgi:hypothetical protein
MRLSSGGDQLTQSITSDKLKGLEVDNNAHRYAAPSFGTGAMKLASNRDPAFVRSWRLEFDCETTSDRFWRYTAEFHDLMREVLRENGIHAS